MSFNASEYTTITEKIFKDISIILKKREAKNPERTINKLKELFALLEILKRDPSKLKKKKNKIAKKKASQECPKEETSVE